MHALLAALLLFPAQEFEVASIKPAAPDARGTYVRTSEGGRVNVTNMTLKDMITLAYRIQPYQILGGPAWISTARYDISAKPEKAPKDGEVPLMLQALLKDRFQLTLQRETKDLPIYALVVARKDGKLGPNLLESKEGSCTVPDRNAPPKPGQRNCGQQMMSPRSLNAVSAPMSQVIPMLARMLGRTVVDKTGLTGKYDIDVQWTPDETQLAMLSPEARAASSDASGPSIFTALQEQLGLKLESQKGPVEVFAVERAEKPSEN
jgi:uncharacterized protein (TIGR03435 family)